MDVGIRAGFAPLVNANQKDFLTASTKLNQINSSIFFQLGSFSTKHTSSPECVCNVITILSLDVSAGRACSKSNLYRTTHLCRDLHRSNIWEQHDCYHIHGILCQHHLLNDLYKTYYYAWTSNRAIFRHLCNKSSLPHMCQVIFGS